MGSALCSGSHYGIARGTVTNTTFKHYGNPVTEPTAHQDARTQGRRGLELEERAEEHDLRPPLAAGGRGQRAAGAAQRPGGAAALAAGRQPQPAEPGADQCGGEPRQAAAGGPRRPAGARFRSGRAAGRPSGAGRGADPALRPDAGGRAARGGGLPGDRGQARVRAAGPGGQPAPAGRGRARNSNPVADSAL